RSGFYARSSDRDMLSGQSEARSIFPPSDVIRPPRPRHPTTLLSPSLADDTRATHHIHHGTALPRGRLLPGYDPQVCLPSHPFSFPGPPHPSSVSPSSRSPTPPPPPRLTSPGRKRPPLPGRRLQAPRHNPHHPPRRKLPQHPARPLPAPHRPHPEPRTLRVHPPHQSSPGPLISRHGQDQGFLHHQARGR